MGRYGFSIGVASTDFTLDGKFLFNHDNKQFVNLNEYKAASIDKHGWCIHPLPLVTAVGNDRGGGDFHEGNTDLKASEFGLGNLFPLPTSRPQVSAKLISDSLKFVEVIAHAENR